MKVRSFLIFFSFFFSICLSTHAQPALLTTKDVKDVMSQLFEYHIDKKQMNTALLERSLKIYLKQFDATRSYLLQEEINTYVYPSDQMLRKMLNDYDNQSIAIYFSLNQKIQESILRARSWRKSWLMNPKQLIEDAKKVEPQKVKETSYAKNVSDLQERHYKRFIEFLSIHLPEIGGDSSKKADKLVLLCDKQLAHMENEYLGLDDQGRPLPAPMQEHLIVLRTLKSLANSLDAHTAYYSPEEAYAMKVQLEKGMCGIGVVLKEGIDGIMVQEVILGGPAAKSGMIHKGDTIVEVDGKPIQNFSFQRVMEIMKGKEGTKTILGILRPKDVEAEFLRVELIRSKIILADQRVDVQSEPFGDGIIGKITLHSFYEGDDGISSEKDLKKAIDELRQNKPLYGLVLDMRENTGGFLSQSVKVAGLFIASGVVVISKYSDNTMKFYRTLDGVRYYDGPLVVLISRGSASATEIVAQALKDYGVAVVVGDEQTYGKGTIQHQTITSEGPPAFFKVTIGKYYSVSGKSTQIEGVKADIVVPSVFNFEEIGEAYLEYPIAADWVEPAYRDTLSDIDPMARRWFQKYYLPTLQQKESRFENWMPTLKANSTKRVKQNRNFQIFLKEIQEEIKPIKVTAFGSNDLQMEEAVNIVKDMIILTEKQAVAQ